MNQVQKAIEHVEQKCRSKGIRLTKKRKLILSSLLTSEKAMSAYELIDYCKQEYDEVLPAMSVYRILEFLQQEQLVHRLNLVNKYVACCHIDCDHSHDIAQFLICGKCQKVKEISLEKATEEKLKLDVEKAGFQMESPQLEINGVCDMLVWREREGSAITCESDTVSARYWESLTRTHSCNGGSRTASSQSDKLKVYMSLA